MGLRFQDTAIGFKVLNAPHFPSFSQFYNTQPNLLRHYAWSQPNRHYDRCLLALLCVVYWQALLLFTDDPALHDPAFGTMRGPNEPALLPFPRGWRIRCN